MMLLSRHIQPWTHVEVLRYLDTIDILGPYFTPKRPHKPLRISLFMRSAAKSPHKLQNPCVKGRIRPAYGTLCRAYAGVYAGVYAVFDPLENGAGGPIGPRKKLIVSFSNFFRS